MVGVVKRLLAAAHAAAAAAGRRQVRVVLTQCVVGDDGAETVGDEANLQQNRIDNNNANTPRLTQ